MINTFDPFLNSIFRKVTATNQKLSILEYVKKNM